MRIQTEGTLLHGAKLVFLDTAAWAYMESGSAPVATAELRALCADGRARILVTADHLTEVGGLTTGRKSRIAFMHAFPGTILLRVGGAQMTKLGAFAFALRALGEDMQPQPLHCTELRTESLEELSKMADQTLPLRLAYRYQAWAASKTFNRNTKETKQHREMITKLLRLARSGDVDAVVDYARQRKPFGRVGTLGQVLAARALVSLFRWGNERGILSSSAKTDFLFDQYVSSALPREFSSNPELMGPLFKVWSKPGALEAFSPSLACVVAIARKATPTKDMQKLRSTEIDKHHASFAPLVDVFTCDSRIEPLVARTLKGKQPSTVVVRSSPMLQSVVDAVRGNT